jgi:TPR repeat protein
MNVTEFYAEVSDRFNQTRRVSYSELNEMMPPDEVTSKFIEDFMDLLSENGIKVFDDEDGEGGPIRIREFPEKLENPLSQDERQHLLSLSRFAKENGLLKPYQRRYLYQAGKFDEWYGNRVPKFKEAISDLSDAIREDDHLSDDDDLPATLQVYILLINASVDDSFSENMLGDYFLFGLHQEIDNKKAIYWFERAASHGALEALVSIGKMRLEGIGVEQSEGEAMKLFHRAAEQGDAEARYMIATNSEEDEAIQWYQLAAGQGHDEAQYMLGHSYWFGNGVEEDRDVAIDCFKKAAKSNNAMAKCRLGEAYRDKYFLSPEGEGDEWLEKAVDWFEQAVEHGDQMAQWQLGQLYNEGIGVEQDYQQARELFEKASEYGEDCCWTNSQALLQLGEIYQKGLGVKQDHEESFRLFQLSYEYCSSAEAVFEIGVCYTNGDGVEQNFDRAMSCFQEAASEEDDQSECAIGEFYYHGHGVDIDFHEAFRWFLMAAERGHSGAQEYLVDMYESGDGTKVDFEKAAHWQGVLDGDEDIPKPESAQIITFPETRISNRPTGVVQSSDISPISVVTIHSGVGKYIQDGEGQLIEFKSSFEWNHREEKRDILIGLNVVRAIASFQNSDGGMLLIGIDDDGNPVGIQKDLEILKTPSNEKFQRHLVQICSDTIGIVATKNITVTFEDYEGAEICLVDVNPSEKPVIVNPEKRYKDKKTGNIAMAGCFFVRQGNMSKNLSTKDAVDWTYDKWSI